MALTTAQQQNLLMVGVGMFDASLGVYYMNALAPYADDLDWLYETLENTDAFHGQGFAWSSASTNEDFADALLTRLLGDPDTNVTAANWTAAYDAVVSLLNGGTTRGAVMKIAVDFLVGTDTADENWGDAAAMFQNKLAVATYYTVELSGTATDVGTLQNTLADVTSDPASVDAANDENAVTAGQTFALTSAPDNILGTAGNDSINGIFGDATNSNNTYNGGDVIDAGNGTDTMNLVASDTTASTNSAIVRNVETINVQDVLGSTVNALLIENAPAINFTSTQAGATSTVTNAALASVVGLAGKGNLTVDYASTSGTADLANVSLSTAGTSATARSTVDVSDTNTVEKVAIDTSGTNFVTLTAGTAAATVTITGDGTNNFDISGSSSVNAVATIDASASTGTNTFVMGATLNTADVIKGGTGADTISAGFSAAALIKPTVTGVETLTADFDAGAIVDLSLWTELTTVNLAGGSASQTLSKAPATLAAVNLTSQSVGTDVDNDLTISHATDVTGALALKLGSTSTSAADVTVDELTLSGTTSLALSTVGTKNFDIATATTVDGDQSSVSIDVATTSDLFINAGIVVDGDVGSFTTTIGAASNYSGGLMATGDVGDVTMTLGAGASGVSTVSGGGSIGNITVTGNGANVAAHQAFNAADGDVGDISVSVTGTAAWAELSGGAFGSIGDISISLIGNTFSGGASVSAGDDSTDESLSNIGNITINLEGNTGAFSGGFETSGGDIGNVIVNLTGNDSSGKFSFNANMELHDDANGSGVYDGGGNIGDITYDVDGGNAYLYLNATASGGDIGNISLTADNGAHLEMWVSANAWSGGDHTQGGSIGNITITSLNGSSVSGDMEASGGDIGDITVTSVDNRADSGGWVSIYASWSSGGDGNDYIRGGNVGDVTLSVTGSNADFGLLVLAKGGNIGDVNFTVDGSSSSAGLYLGARSEGDDSPGGNIGEINVTVGDDVASWDMGIGIDGATGPITITQGDGVSGWFMASGGWNGSISAAAQDQAELGLITATLGDGGSLSINVGELSGYVDGISVTAGDSSYVGIWLDNVNHDIGDVTVTMGTDAEADIWASGGGNMDPDSIGLVTLAGGDSTSTASGGYVDTSDTVNSHGGFNAAAFNGMVNINLEGVVLGTVINSSKGGSTVKGSEGADNIFLGAGVDQVVFDASPTAVDTIFSFKGGSGFDTLDLTNVANFTAYTVDTADTLSSGDITKLTDITGNQDITTAAGLLAALNTGGEYASIDATAAGSTYTFVTAASATATTFYVFDAVETADAEFNSVTLIGVVNSSTAFSALVTDNLI